MWKINKIIERGSICDTHGSKSVRFGSSPYTSNSILHEVLMNSNVIILQ